MNISGMPGKPGGRIIVKIPPYNTYITYGSLVKIITDCNKEWYLLPLYGGKRRRIGNLQGTFWFKQIPGFLIYKVYTRNRIRS
jgi:hypothetical protein